MQRNLVQLNQRAQASGQGGRNQTKRAASIKPAAIHKCRARRQVLIHNLQNTVALVYTGCGKHCNLAAIAADADSSPGILAEQSHTRGCRHLNANKLVGQLMGLVPSLSSRILLVPVLRAPSNPRLPT